MDAPASNRRYPARFLRALPLAALASISIAAGTPAGDEVEEARITLAKWVEVRRTISKERQDWALGREMLADRIAIVRREIETLRGSIQAAQDSVAEADRKRAELVADNEALTGVSKELADAVRGLEARTKALLPRCPEPIRERVRPLSQMLPEDPQTTKLGLSERFRNVVGTLNEVTKFQREVALSSEIRELGDGRSAEVTAVYFGVAQGYYVGGDGRSAGFGNGAGEGWTWTASDGAAPGIAAVIAVLENERVAEFVRLPARIQ
jgi:hypothetical protein